MMHGYYGWLLHLSRVGNPLLIGLLHDGSRFSLMALCVTTGDPIDRWEQYSIRRFDKNPYYLEIDSLCGGCDQLQTDIIHYNQKNKKILIGRFSGADTFRQHSYHHLKNYSRFSFFASRQDPHYTPTFYGAKGSVDAPVKMAIHEINKSCSLEAETRYFLSPFD